MEIVNKVYEAETLFQSVTSRAEQYKELKGQLEKLKQEFVEIVNNDQFLGKGAEAIKGFYGAQMDVVDAWISFINMNIAFFEGIEGTAEEKTLSGETVVKMPFLEGDLAQSNKRAYEMVSQQKEDLQDIFDDINDLISLNVFSSEQFETYMEKAEDERTKTIEKVNELDGDLTTEYAVSEQAEIYIFALYAQLLEATKQGEKISPLYFNEKAYQTSEVYQLKDDMEKQGDTYLTFKKEQREAREVQKEIEAQANKSKDSGKKDFIVGDTIKKGNLTLDGGAGMIENEWSKDGQIGGKSSFSGIHVGVNQDTNIIDSKFSQDMLKGEGQASIGGSGIFPLIKTSGSFYNIQGKAQIDKKVPVVGRIGAEAQANILKGNAYAGVDNSSIGIAAKASIADSEVSGILPIPFTEFNIKGTIGGSAFGVGGEAKVGKENVIDLRFILGVKVGVAIEKE